VGSGMWHMKEALHHRHSLLGSLLSYEGWRWYQHHHQHQQVGPWSTCRPNSIGARLRGEYDLTPISRDPIQWPDGSPRSWTCDHINKLNTRSSSEGPGVILNEGKHVNLCINIRLPCILTQPTRVIRRVRLG